MSSNRHEPLFDVHPVTGTSIEVFYTDRTLETFGWSGAGWFWWPRRRGFAPDCPAKGPFPSQYTAYRNAVTLPRDARPEQRAPFTVNADTLRTSPFSVDRQVD